MTGKAYSSDSDYTVELAGIRRYLVHTRNFDGGSIRMLRRRDAGLWRDLAKAPEALPTTVCALAGGLDVSEATWIGCRNGRFTAPGERHCASVWGVMFRV
jgi:hypothetical protein